MMVLPPSTFLRFGALQGLVVLACVMVEAVPILHSAEGVKSSFDLPADTLERSVKRFAAQSGLEVLIPGDAMSDIRTQTVRGTMTSRQALDAMLAGTGLTVLQDPKTRAFAIRKGSSDPNGQRAARENPGDRPRTSDEVADTPKSMKRKTPLTILAAWLALALGPAEMAQGANRASAPAGTISGRVLNLATGANLMGARVSLESPSRTVLTAHDGSFALGELPPGEYRLKVHYTGVDTHSLSVTLAAGENIYREIGMTSEIYTLAPFTVAGIREENAMAIQAQRHAPNSKTVVATSAYGTPSDNPGELIQRLSGVSVNIVAGEVADIYIRGMGPSFSKLLVDGEAVAISGGNFNADNGGRYIINEMGTANLSQVELVKAPTPDQDADAIAGYVNLVTKRSFDQTGRKLTLNLGSTGHYWGFKNAASKNRFKNIDRISVSYSDVFSVLGREKNLGISFDFAQTNLYRFDEGIGTRAVGSISSTYLNPASENPLTRLFAVEDFSGPVEKYTYGLGADYKISGTSFVFAKFSMTTQKRFQENYLPFFGRANATAAFFSPDSVYERSTLLASPTTLATMRSDNSLRESVHYSLTAGSEHKLFEQSATLSLRGSYTMAESANPYSTVIDAVATGIGFEIDRRDRDPWYPKFTQTAGPDIYDPASYRISTVNATVTEGAPSTLYMLRADLEKRFDTAVPSSIKLGAKRSVSSRYDRRRNEQYTWVGADGIPGSPDDSLALHETRMLHIGKGGYGPFNFLPLIRTKEDLDSNPRYWAQTAAQAYASVNASNAQNNDVDQTIEGYYLSGRVELGRLRILGGVRAERVDIESESWVRNQTVSWGGNNAGGTSMDPAIVEANRARAERSFVARRKSSNSYTDVFPGLHFVFEPKEGMLLRASYNRGISRPPISATLPTLSQNDENQTITVGNPDLKPYLSENFEGSAEKYFEPVGLVSVGVFLKEIQNYFRSFSDVVGSEGIDGNGLFTGYRMTTSRNVGRARIRGFETSVQQQFSFLPGLARGLGAFANFTFTETLGNFGGLSISRRLPRLSPRTLNYGVSYSYRGWETRIMANWMDETYMGTDGNVDYFGASRTLLDLKVQYAFSKRYSLQVNVSNLTGEATTKHITRNGLYWQKLDPGTSFVVGVTGKF